MLRDPELLTRRVLADYLGKHGFPISLHTLNRLGARGDGPPAAGIWGGQFLYDPVKTLAWARSRFRSTEFTRGSRRRRAA
jgi:hypothetical protein